MTDNIANTCPGCGKYIEPDWKACPSCGASLEAMAPAGNKTLPIPTTPGGPGTTQGAPTLIQPQPQDQPQGFQQPPPQQPPQYQQPPKHTTMQSVEKYLTTIEKLFTKQIIVMGIAIALLLMFLGAVVMNISTVNDDKPDNEDMAKGLGRHQNGAILYNLGVLLLVAILFGGAIYNNELDQFVRLGFLIAAGLIGFNQYGA